MLKTNHLSMKKLHDALPGRIERSEQERREMREKEAGLFRRE
jgi:hypothetical protein